MARTTYINICDKKYLIVFNARVLCGLEALDKNIDTIMRGRKMSDIIELLHLMVDAGDRYAKANEMENSGTLSTDELKDILDIPALREITASIGNTIYDKRTVQSKPPKK